MAKTLHLVIPGLFGPWPLHKDAEFPGTRAATLEQLLARASVKPLGVTGTDATLFRLFRLSVSPDRDLPIAAVTRLIDAGHRQEGWWLRADPVNLQADLHQVVLIDPRTLDITMGEARSLAAEFNKTFNRDGWILETLHPKRWYLRLEDEPQLRTYPLPEAIGQDIRPRLPWGPAHRRWHVLLTEIQMLFHESAVNIEREARAQPPINSVWFWGGGKLPQAVSNPYDGIYATDILTQGLARLTTTPINPLPPNALEWREAADDKITTLVVLETTRYDSIDNAPYRWSEHIHTLEKDWFILCLSLLKERFLEKLHLYPCDGHGYTITPPGLRRFWRRTRPLQRFF